MDSSKEISHLGVVHRVVGRIGRIRRCEAGTFGVGGEVFDRGAEILVDGCSSKHVFGKDDDDRLSITSSIFDVHGEGTGGSFLWFFANEFAKGDGSLESDIDFGVNVTSIANSDDLNLSEPFVLETI